MVGWRLHVQHPFTQNLRPAGRVGRLAMNPLDRSWMAVATGVAAGRGGQSPAPSQGRLFSLDAALWQALLGLLGIAAVAGLLLAFLQVVRGGMQQSELRQRTAAAHADAVWRCNGLRIGNQRASCLAQLKAGQALDAMTAEGHDDPAPTVARAVAQSNR